MDKADFRSDSASDESELEAYIDQLKIPYHAKTKIKKLIKRLAEQDPDTRCLRKKYFLRKLYDSLREANTDKRGRDRRSDWLGLWVFDLANFKATNDTLGHATGDVILKRVARILRSSIRSRGPGDEQVDIPGRLGGDEFGALLSKVTDDTGALEAARRFKMRVDERKWQVINPALEYTLRPRADLGVVCFKTATVELVDDPDELQLVADRWYYHADQLMYSSKRHNGDIFFRCMGYDRSKSDLVEVDPEVFRIHLARRHT